MMPSINDLRSNGIERNASPRTVIERDQSQWLFTPAELRITPSVLNGMSVEQEAANRQKGVNFITQVGIMLKLPQLTLATASVYLHRFFMRHSMLIPDKAGLHHYSAAATSLFLATKVEENVRKMKELVVACCRVAQKQPNLVVDEQNKEYWKWRDVILNQEPNFLEYLCFDLQLESPYRILFDFLQYYNVQDNKALRNTSWAFLNDSHVTTMCLLHSPKTISGAALYVGARLAAITLADDEHGRPWWEHLDLDILEIQRACNLMFEVYENPALARVGAKDAYRKEEDVTAFDKTRGPGSFLSPRADMSPTSRSVRSNISHGTKRDRDEAESGQSEEWGARSDSRRPSDTGNPLPPSPKRQRRETPDDSRRPHPQQSSSQIPPAAVINGASSRVPDYNSRRIGPSTNPNVENADDVQRRIDSIVAANPPPTGPGADSATLARRPSNHQQWQGPPPRRRSDSTNNWQRPPSAGSRPDSLHESGGGISMQKSDSARGDPADRRNGGHDNVDEEQVDYGSEEGEV